MQTMTGNMETTIVCDEENKGVQTSYLEINCKRKGRVLY
jgi:hypothetical protein